MAGFTATNKLYGLLESSAISSGFAITTYMAQNYGAGRMDRVRLGIRRAVVLLVGVAVGIAVLMIAVGKHLLRLFISAAPELEAAVLDSAYSYLFVMSLFLIILYLLFAYRSALQGLGNTWAPLLSGFLEFRHAHCRGVYVPRLFGSIRPVLRRAGRVAGRRGGIDSHLLLAGKADLPATGASKRNGRRGRLRAGRYPLT